MSSSLFFALFFTLYLLLKRIMFFQRIERQFQRSAPVADAVLAFGIDFRKTQAERFIQKHIIKTKTVFTAQSVGFGVIVIAGTENVLHLVGVQSFVHRDSEDILYGRLVQYREIRYYKSDIENLFEDIKKWNTEKKSIYVMISTKEKAKKLKELFEKEDILCKIEEKLDQTINVKSTENIVTIAIGKLTAGLENFEINQIVIAADELIEGGKKKKSIIHQAYKEGEKVVFADLKIGDYVVHKNYGIGIFIGVNTITADGTTKDYIKIKYNKYIK